MHQNVSTEYHHDNREVQKKYEQRPFVKSTKLTIKWKQLT
jgi:hypothetical protein